MSFTCYDETVRQEKKKALEKGAEKQAGLFLVNLLRGALAALLLWLVLGNLDWYDPSVNLKPAVTVLGPQTEFLLEAVDKDTGLRDLRVAIIQAGAEKEVFSRSFPYAAGILGAKGARITKLEFPFVLDVQALGLKDGRASIEVTAHDYSWRNRFRGRIATLTREVVIDLKMPPRAM